MNLHEYQAKNLLKIYGINTPEHVVASTTKEAELAVQTLKGNTFAIKAQIHAGGRGKGGGIKLAKNLDEVKEKASQIFAHSRVSRHFLDALMGL